MSFCQQRAGSLCPGPCVTHVEQAGCSKSGAIVWTVMSQEVRSYPASWLCWDRLMQFILKVPGRSVLAFHVVTMAVGPNNYNGGITDDTTIVGLITDNIELANREEVQHFAE
ncbi:hypothetical protein ILYODFUR_038110 [Ilyodon furcidens]|uniref:Uncharacterized protein n=1 Tax=Ilyodon furcidens TaxID=33524 RepID=A0ABV0VM09_9TELE